MRLGYPKVKDHLSREAGLLLERWMRRYGTEPERAPARPGGGNSLAAVIGRGGSS